MKSREITKGELSSRLNISRFTLDQILKLNTIDTALLVQISIALGTNLFEYYYHNAELKRLSSHTLESFENEVEHLKAILEEKTRMLDLKDEMIKSQAKMIISLEKLLNR
jgi:predicted transcriptional regulator